MAEKRIGVYISFEKVLLILVIVLIWVSVLLIEKVMPQQSAALLMLSFIAVYGVLISMANYHHRRRIAKGHILPPDINTDYHPSVSIVVPAHNEAFVIADTIENMMAIDYDTYDLWIFDDRSTDGTADVLKAMSEKYPGRFHYVIRPPDAIPGKSAVLNDALEVTIGDIIVVFDGDGRVEPDFLKKALPYLADHGVGAVQARKIIMNADTNLLTRCQNHEYMLDAHFQSGRDAIRGAAELRGNGQLVKRVALQSVGGWTEDTITDDLDLSTKLHLAGWDIRFTSKTGVREEGIVRFKPLLKQRRRWAEGNLKRYLEHGVHMFTSPHVSHRSTVDMTAYFIQFLFPLWIATDIILQFINLFIRDWPTHWMSSFIIIPAMAVFFVSGLFMAIRHYEHPGFWRTLTGAVETAVFLVVVWVPVVMWITAKVLVSRDDAPLNWGKTEHLGTQHIVPQSKLQRIKNLIRGS